VLVAVPLSASKGDRSQADMDEAAGAADAGDVLDIGSRRAR
jgi:hypothetical protein